MKSFGALKNLVRRIHRDERGVVSLETVLIIGAIAIPVLIIIVKFGWPKIKAYFDKGMQDLEQNSDRAIQNG